MDTLYDLNRRDGITVMISLHQVEYALSYCKRTIALRDGYLLYDGPSTAITPQFLNELYGEESEDLLLPDLLSPPGLEQQYSTTESGASVRTERQPKARQFADSLETTPAT